MPCPAFDIEFAIVAAAVSRGMCGTQRAARLIALAPHKQRRYKGIMCALNEVGGKGLPRAIPAEELQKMLGSSAAFCSRRAASSTTCDLITRWPFLFSRPRSITAKSQYQPKSL